MCFFLSFDDEEEDELFLLFFASSTGAAAAGASGVASMSMSDATGAGAPRLRHETKHNKSRESAIKFTNVKRTQTHRDDVYAPAAWQFELHILEQVAALVEQRPTARRRLRGRLLRCSGGDWHGSGLYIESTV